MEQHDDEYELVLAAGLVRWRTPDEQDIRRHLLVEQLVPSLDKDATVRLTRLPGKKRLEDRELFEGQPDYRAERAREVKERILGSETSPLSERSIGHLRNWLGLALDTSWQESTSDVRSELPDAPTFSVSAAVILRPRNKVLLAEAYRRIAEMLRAPDCPVPVGLAQLVVDTEREQRADWLSSQGAASGDLLGADPLFPLPANAEQSRVIELLRSETGVVVQGPPGTGKTHTIANLISALLARGQRVLVTSQKDQALRVLRDKIPDELRKLCVLLTGGSKDAAVEVRQSLDALAQAVALNDRPSLKRRTEALDKERKELLVAGNRLNIEVRRARTVELDQHSAVVPGYREDRYRGTLADIVREVVAGAPKHDWIPPVPDTAHDVPPLPPAELSELTRLLAQRDDQPDRLDQQIPDAAELPTAQQLADLVRAEQQAQQQAGRTVGHTAQALAGLPEPQLTRLRDLGQRAEPILARYGSEQPPAGQEWVLQALADRFADRHQGLWADLLSVREEPARLQRQLHSHNPGLQVDKPTIDPDNLGTARGWLRSGQALLEHLRAGGSLRRFLPRAPQKDARELLDVVRVDGRAPRNADELAAVLEVIEAETAAAQLVAKWRQVGVTVHTGEVKRTLSELADNATALDAVTEVGELRRQIAAILAAERVAVDLSTVPNFTEVLRAIPAAEQQRAWERARDSVIQLHELVRNMTHQLSACPELEPLRIAVDDRDVAAFTAGLRALDAARAQHREQQHRESLLRTMTQVHPELVRLWQDTRTDPVWQERDVRAAWAWSRARRFVQRHRTAEHERELLTEYERVEERLRQVTEQLAAAEATGQCLDRMSDDHSRALHAYQAHINKIGAGTGKKTKEFRRAARQAMDKAQGAVPAWVVPLPNLLENIEPIRNRFDVVIVDEASQVGIEHLYLLWMAPRVIVVGDEKQCTPGIGQMGKLDRVFDAAENHLAELDEDIRRIFTPKSHLYEVLSARSGKDGLVRLREHFRCVPEIINWSSRQFYQDGSGGSGLVPLRERTGDQLEPLRVTLVEDAFNEGRDARLCNEKEATDIVETLAKCLRDPSYDGKTFGIVVLRSAKRHVQLLENLISKHISPEDREERKIRVGTAPDFQGDERHVVFLSMVVAEPPRLTGGESYRQAFNVAASRAKDQMWLFTSLPLDQFKSNDLRYSLLDYMQDPPPVFGASPELADVPENRPAEGFDSMFEQRVFRELKQRGYHVVPQYPVGSRRLDLVVVGEGGRVAVECDGHYWHAGLDNERNDAERDRELARMKWTTIRVRESEFELSRKRELAPVLEALHNKNIQPGFHGETARGVEWTPVQTDDIDALDESEQE
ncbi:AAA domain-containing protein [Saccharopolyspora gregorii]|uniref:AAA domain-containing protein n=1 Tax=Saccharopolyspora gregorii TaxID=33914 RepID=UPI0021758B82|nr:AAA domain-containing protein [Saccharopolyspora gregorii]